MAKLVKVKDFKREAKNYINKHMKIFDSTYETLKHLFNEPREQVYIIVYVNDSAAALVNISKASSATESSVQLDEAKVEEVFSKIDGLGYKYAISHNHPYMTNDKGEWVETLVSDADVVTTYNIRRVQDNLYPDIEYVGHFVVNKEGDNDRKIIMFNDDIKLKYTKAILNKIKDKEF